MITFLTPTSICSVQPDLFGDHLHLQSRHVSSPSISPIDSPTSPHTRGCFQSICGAVSFLEPPHTHPTTPRTTFISQTLQTKLITSAEELLFLFVCLSAIANCTGHCSHGYQSPFDLFYRLSFHHLDVLCCSAPAPVSSTNQSPEVVSVPSLCESGGFGLNFGRFHHHLPTRYLSHVHVKADGNLATVTIRHRKKHEDINVFKDRNPRMLYHFMACCKTTSRSYGNNSSLHEVTITSLAKDKRAIITGTHWP